MCRILSLLVLLIGASCSELTRTKDEITQNAQVYAEDSFNPLKKAKKTLGMFLRNPSKPLEAKTEKILQKSIKKGSPDGKVS